MIFTIQELSMMISALSGEELEYGESEARTKLIEKLRGMRDALRAEIEAY